MDDPPPYKDVGARIKKAMLDRGLRTQIHLHHALRSAAAGEEVALSSISNWMTGKVLPTRHAELLSRVLGTEWRFLRWGPTGAPPASSEAPDGAPVDDELEKARALLERHGLRVVPVADVAPEPDASPPPPAPPPRHSGVRAGRAAQHPSGSARRPKKRA